MSRVVRFRVRCVAPPEPPRHPNYPMLCGRHADLSDCEIHAITDDGQEIAVPGVSAIEFSVQRGEAAGMTLHLENAEAEIELLDTMVVHRLASLRKDGEAR